MNALPTSPYPQTEKLFRLAEGIWAKRPDLHRAFNDIRSPDFWYWLNWHGSEEYAEVRDLLPPIPPKYIMDRTGGGHGRSHITGGLVDWRTITRCLQNNGLDLDGDNQILEFGSGCGRLIRHFARYATLGNLYGTDVDEDGIRWCQQNLPHASFALGPFDPPTTFSDEQFSAIYAFSVFSHLSEKRHLAWLTELARIARPGAIVVLTKMGRNCLELICDHKRPDAHPGASEARAAQDQFAKDGLSFFPYQTFKHADKNTREHFSKWDLDAYGTTFIADHYVKRHWLENFELLELLAAPNLWQDYVVLRRS